jgi:hypothetical protein
MQHPPSIRKACRHPRSCVFALLGILLCIVTIMTIWLDLRPGPPIWEDLEWIETEFHSSTATTVRVFVHADVDRKTWIVSNVQVRIATEKMDNDRVWKEFFLFRSQQQSNKLQGTRYAGYSFASSNSFRFVYCSVTDEVSIRGGGNSSNHDRITMDQWTDDTFVVDRMIQPVVQAVVESQEMPLRVALQRFTATAPDFFANQLVPAAHLCNEFAPREHLHVPTMMMSHLTTDQRPSSRTEFHQQQQQMRLRLLRQSLPQLSVVTGCSKLQLRNGICDDECNEAQWDWDGGDCCAQSADEVLLGKLRHYDCKTGPKVLLLHGASVHIGNGDNLAAQFSDKTKIDIEKKLGIWGPDLITKLQPFSSQLIFNAHNTFDYGWNDHALQQAYYNKALEVYTAGGIVFAHAFANLVLAGACADQHLCSVKWYAIGPPFRGARITELPYPVHGIAIDLNNTGIQSLRPSFRGLFDGSLTQVVRNHGLLLGCLCGTSAYGSGGMVGVELAGMTSLSTHQSPWFLHTDGVVALAECALDGDGVRAALPRNLWTPLTAIDWQNVVPLGDFQIGNASHPFTILDANHQDLYGKSFGETGQVRTAVARWFLSPFV